MGRETIERYFRAGAERDFDELAMLRHPEWTAEWPQSGERVPSHEADRRIHEQYEGYPAHELRWAATGEERWAALPLLPVRVSGAGDVWMGEALLTYADGPQFAAAILELRDGLVWRETEYWAAPFDPPAWRTHLTEAIPAPDRARVVRGASPDEERARRSSLERFYASVAAAPTPAEQRAAYLAGLRELFAEDAVQELPQSGELVRGISNITALVEGHPDFPGGEITRITGAGDLFAVEGRLVYDQGVFFEVMFMQFRGDRVCRSTEYYGAPFEAPAWRAGLVERMASAPGGTVSFSGSSTVAGGSGDVAEGVPRTA